MIWSVCPAALARGEQGLIITGKPATQFLRKLGYISSTDFEVSLCVFSISFGNLPLEGQIGEEDRVGLPLGAINATR